MSSSSSSSAAASPVLPRAYIEVRILLIQWSIQTKYNELFIIIRAPILLEFCCQFISASILKNDKNQNTTHNILIIDKKNNDHI